MTDEHPIPLGFWGLFKLVRASCKSCATVTSDIERQILRDNLRRPREFLGAPTRHSRKNGNWSGRFIVRNDAGHEMDVPIDAISQFALLPIYNFIPRKLFKDIKGKRHRTIDVKLCPFENAQDPNLSGYWGPSVRMNGALWARFLAKVAYGEYIRTIDSKFRSPAVSKFILKGYGDLSNFVGGRSEAPSTNYMYNVGFCAYARANGDYAIACYIRLLSFLESPLYLIHLGEIPADEPLPVNLPINQNWERGNVWPIYSDYSGKKT